MPEAIISDILVVPHSRLSSDSTEQRISVGLLLNSGAVSWQLCLVRGHPAPLADSISQRVMPAWVGQSLADPAALLDALDALQEDVTYTEPVPQQPDNTGISRRDLLTGAAWRKQASAPPTRTISQRQALHPAIRFALSMALLQAYSLWLRQSLVQTLIDYWGEVGQTHEPALVYSQSFPGRADLWQAAVAWGWRLPPEGAASQIDGTALQRVVRRTRQALEQLAPAQWPQHLFIQAAGWFDRFYEGDTGKILGALYGLEQVCKPLPLLIENPFPASPERLADWRTLHEYLSFRKQNVYLMAHSHDATATTALLQSGVLAAMRLQPEALGSLSLLRTRIMQCRTANVPVMLATVEPSHAQAVQQLALLAATVGADWLAVAADTAVWLAPDASVALQRHTAWLHATTMTGKG